MWLLFCKGNLNYTVAEITVGMGCMRREFSKLCQTVSDVNMKWFGTAQMEAAEGRGRTEWNWISYLIKKILRRFLWNKSRQRNFRWGADNLEILIFRIGWKSCHFIAAKQSFGLYWYKSCFVFIQIWSVKFHINVFLSWHILRQGLLIILKQFG